MDESIHDYKNYTVYILVYKRTYFAAVIVKFKYANLQKEK